ncbi:hypothetical protein DM793_01830 [Paenarthrobacter nitroguajacolicus]|nr:hypothetical protein [Paenarthrobacter nitroguajacolicus]
MGLEVVEPVLDLVQEQFRRFAESSCLGRLHLAGDFPDCFDVDRFREEAFDCSLNPRAERTIAHNEVTRRNFRNYRFASLRDLLLG